MRRTNQTQEIDWKRFSTDVDYCFQILKQSANNHEPVSSLTPHLEKCSMEVILGLLDFERYLLIELLHNGKQAYHFYGPMILAILHQQKLPYDILICNLIPKAKILIYEPLISFILTQFLIDDAEFRENFIADKKYHPFLHGTFYDKLAKHFNKQNNNHTVTLDWGELKSTPLLEEQRMAAVEKMYSFKEPKSNEQKSIIAVAGLLKNKEVVFAQLSKLEKILKERKRKLFLSGMSPYEKGVKLLSGYLSQWARDNGFSGYAKSLKDVPGKLMLKNFSEGLLFKDKAFRGIGHGEWPHFLQWYILTEAHRDNNCLPVKPRQLLVWIGKQSDGSTIWDNTFEAPSPVTSANSLYDPEFDAGRVLDFSYFLLSEECQDKFPVLHEVIYKRSRKFPSKKEKDLGQKEEDPNNNASEYVTIKRFEKQR